MHVVFVGEPDDGRTVSAHHARVLGRSGCRVSFDPPGEHLVGPGLDAVHLVTAGQSEDRLLRNVLAARASRIPVARFWTGADLIWARYHEPTRAVSQAWAKAGVAQLCRTDEARADLAGLGIEALVAPLVSASVASDVVAQPLPQQFTALCYLPEDRRDYYGGALIDDLIRWMPQVRFLILGDDSERYAEWKHVESLGVAADVQRAIQRSTVIVHARLDRSPSRLMLEALALGRHVVTNVAWPDCRLAGSVDEFMTTLRALRRDVTFNLTGREAVCRTSDPRVAATQLRAIMEQVRSGGGITAAFRSARQANLALGEVGGDRRKRFPVPDPADVPAEIAAFRALLQRRVPQSAGAPR